MFGCWVGEILHFASLPRIEKEAAQSKYAVSLFGMGGLEQIVVGGCLAQPGGSHLKSCLVLLIEYLSPAGVPCHPGGVPAALAAARVATRTARFAL